MKLFITAVRIIVGVLFIFSGLIKANDPMGLSYKMLEFFEVWGFSFLNDYTLAFAVIMNTFEIVAGVAILIGWRIRMVSWLLLLLIIFFTFLTGYAMLSGKIKTCGCFGDCVPLTPLTSFTKDLILLVLILIIMAKQNLVKPWLANFANVSIIVLTTIFCFTLQRHVLNYLPVVDCLAYKKGNNILEKMKLPEGAVADSFAIKFKYQKNGKDVLFDMDHFPDDFDSTYVYVDRVQELVRAGTAAAPINDFFLFGENGEDTTQAILTTEGEYIMLFSKNTSSAEADWYKNAKEVSGAAAQKGIPFYVVTATVDAAQKLLPKSETVHYLKGDATVLKTAGRVNPTYFVMKGATVVGKYANADFKKVIVDLKK